MIITCNKRHTVPAACPCERRRGEAGTTDIPAAYRCARRQGQQTYMRRVHAREGGRWQGQQTYLGRVHAREGGRRQGQQPYLRSVHSRKGGGRQEGSLRLLMQPLWHFEVNWSKARVRQEFVIVTLHQRQVLGVTKTCKLISVARHKDLQTL